MTTLSQISSNPSDLIKLAEINLSLNSTALSDEFIEHFDSLMLQISWGVTMLSNLLISNVLFSFLILFDRLGGDWAKRSLVCFIYILDSSNSSSFTFWTSQFTSSSRCNWTGIWTGNSNDSWTDKHSSQYNILFYV